jgi:ribosome-binding protein aMBF1 (putative translation factor)
LRAGNEWQTIALDIGTSRVTFVAARQRNIPRQSAAVRTAKRVHRKPRRETLDLLASNIRALRQVAGWSQDNLAHEAGLYRSYIGDMERCKHNPRLSTLEAVADALRIRLGDLVAPLATAKLKRGTAK